jgi:hypothetical protein
MASGLRAGAFPAKVTVPVTDEAAEATPGHTDTATNPAASHNLFPETRILGSLVIAKTSFLPLSRYYRSLLPQVADCTPRPAVQTTLARPPGVAGASISIRPRLSSL